MYIELLKKVLIDYHRISNVEYKPIYEVKDNFRTKLLIALNKKLSKMKLSICKRVEFTEEFRVNGRDWPSNADTMIGLKRFNNIEFCVNNIY